MSDHRDDGFGEIGSGNSVNECAPVIPAIACESTAESGIGVESVALEGDDSCPDERGVVEAVVIGEHKLLVRI